MTRQSRPTRVPRSDSTPAIVLDAPPAYLARLDDGPLRPGATAGRRIMAALDGLGIAARPTLDEIEAERVRRNFRSGVVLTEAAARPVLSMLEPYTSEADSPEHVAALARGREAVASARARLAASADEVGAYQSALTRSSRADDRAVA